jgi:hypothetical protein
MNLIDELKQIAESGQKTPRFEKNIEKIYNFSIIPAY